MSTFNMPGAPLIKAPVFKPTKNKNSHVKHKVIYIFVPFFYESTPMAPHEADFKPQVFQPPPMAAPPPPPPVFKPLAVPAPIPAAPAPGQSWKRPRSSTWAPTAKVVTTQEPTTITEYPTINLDSMLAEAEAAETTAEPNAETASGLDIGGKDREFATIDAILAEPETTAAPDANKQAALGVLDIGDMVGGFLGKLSDLPIAKEEKPADVGEKFE